MQSFQAMIFFTYLFFVLGTHLWPLSVAVPTLKERLAGRKFYRVQDLAKAVFSELRIMPKEDYAAAMEKWIARLRICLKRRGEYFEGM